MCGIAGIMSMSGRPVSLDEVRAMSAALVHRGPDDEGYFIGPGIGLGHRRLSIIDLESGKQPIPNEDRSVWVVLNGEIYNYRELRRDLESRGHVFRTDTDTETIVHLYEEMGADCVDKLRGMFAFAVWDQKARTLMLARDRLGIKPLFYGEARGRMLFASELKALLQSPEVERQLEWSAVADIVSFLSTPERQSVIRGVSKLPPAHRLIVSPGRAPRLERYWDVHFDPDRTRSADSFAEELRALLREAVKQHMVSDVPLGAFLSGGIDSGAVVAMMSQISEAPVKTFSIGFEESAFNEAGYARRLANHLDTEHHELILKPDVMDVVEDLAWYLDEPFGDSSAIPTYMVSKLAAEHVTVVLSGDGGDELFAGYDRYVVEERERRREKAIPTALRHICGAVGARLGQGVKGRNFLRHIALSGAERYLDASTMFCNEDRLNLFHPGLASHIAAHDPWCALSRDFARYGDDWLSTLQEFDLRHYLPLDILTKVDRMSMAHSIETRVPLLDHRFVELAAQVPPELRLREGCTKYIFKHAMRGCLPPDIIHRQKHGFAVPLNAWFGGELGSFVRDLLLSERSRARQVFDPAAVSKLLMLHNRRGDLDLPLWTLISFELWCRKFLDEPPRAVSVESHSAFNDSPDSPLVAYAGNVRT